MPTPTEIRNLVEQDKFELLMRMPFFGRIICSAELVVVSDPQVPLACTDYRRVFISADSYPRLPEENRLAVLAHEVLHIALRHAFRIGNRDKNRFEKAADIEVTFVLTESLPDPYGIKLKEEWRELTAEQIYELLPTKENKTSAISTHCSPKDNKPDEKDTEEGQSSDDKRESASGSGSGSNAEDGASDNGQGSGNGSGEGSGNGDDAGQGNGSGEGSGSGSNAEDGASDNGQGSGNGSGEGSGNGDDAGQGNGSGEGSGNGDDAGQGNGSGEGSGNGDDAGQGNGSEEGSGNSDNSDAEEGDSSNGKSSTIEGDDSSGNSKKSNRGKRSFDGNQEEFSEFRPQFDAETEMHCNGLSAGMRMDMKMNRQDISSPAIERLLKKLDKPRVKWGTVLRQFLRLYRGGSYSWAHPNRRFISHGLYLPGRYGLKGFSGIVALDTSPSTRPVLSRFVSELVGLIKAFGKYDLTIIECAARITQVWSLSSDEPNFVIEEHKFMGGAGTCFTPVFEYIHEHHQTPNVLIFFTDGEGPAPKIKPPYPVIWMLTKNGKAPVPWGRAINYEES